MSQAVFQRESAVEYFKDLVDRALTNQGVATQELTSYYVVQLLAGFLQQPENLDDGPLSVRLVQALESGGMRQRASLKQIGDLSLFIAGFFSE